MSSLFAQKNFSEKKEKALARLQKKIEKHEQKIVKLKNVYKCMESASDQEGLKVCKKGPSN